MRTRNFVRLTNGEVEEYLTQNDLIFVPVGVVETHGSLPLDCETVLAEAVAMKMAEEAGGLYLTGLPYFFAGATAVARGTVNVSIAGGTAYLGEIARSLFKQGFRRQIYITFHGPGQLTVGPMIREFFEETKAPIIYIDGSGAARKAGNIFVNPESGYDLFAGAYQMRGCLDSIPVDLPESDSVHYGDPAALKHGADFAKNIFALGHHSCTVGYYFDVPKEHVPTIRIKTREELEEHAKQGIALIESLVKFLDIKDIAGKLRRLDQHMNEDVIPKHPHLSR